MSDAVKFPARKPEALLALIRKQFPGLRWNRYAFIDEGWDHEVLILDNKLVFRFPNDQYYLELLKSEVRLLRELKPLVSIRIPDYTYVANDFTVAGYPIISGKSLQKPLFDTLNSKDHSDIAGQLAGLLSTMHTLITDGHDLSYVPGWNFAEEQAETKRLAAEHLAAMLGDRDYAVAQRVLADVDKLVAQRLPTVFVHGDIYSNHLFWDKSKRRLGVIDFSDMSRGDPALDFAELYEYGREFVQAVYDAYAAPKDDTLLERAWTYHEWGAVYLMTDHFVIGKTSFAEARKTFDEIKTLKF